MAGLKSYGVRFYCGEATEEDGQPVSALLQGVYDLIRGGGPSPRYQDGSVAYELRDFESFNGGSSFRGVLAVLRDDAPNIRTAAGLERPVHLDPDEHIIEKNHFLYFRENELLVWQVNGRGSHVSRFEGYLSQIAQHAIVFGEVITRESFRRLQNGIVRKFELKIARTRNAEEVDPGSWEASTFDLMNGADGTTLKIEIGTRRKNAGLSTRAKFFIHRMMERSETKSLKVKLLGQDDPVDLFADCIKDRISVGMVGLYPVRDEIFSALAQAKDRQREALNAYFGVGDRVLV